jgi:hypothetical protein
MLLIIRTYQHCVWFLILFACLIAFDPATNNYHFFCRTGLPNFVKKDSYANFRIF